MEVCEMKDDELEADERKLIKGEITDLSEAEKVEIEKKLEEKVATKKQSWSFSQKLSEWQNWLKTEAAKLAVDYLEEEVKKIKQQIYGLKTSANHYKRKAFENNKGKANKLLAELNTISQKNQTVAPTEKGFLQPKVLIPVALLAVVLAIAAVLVIRKRKQAKVKK